MCSTEHRYVEISFARTGCDKGRVWSGANFIEVWNETIMVSCYTILQSVWQDGKRAGKIIGFVNFFRFDSDPGKEIRRHQDKCHEEHFQYGRNQGENVRN